MGKRLPYGFDPSEDIKILQQWLDLFLSGRFSIRQIATEYEVKPTTVRPRVQSAIDKCDLRNCAYGDYFAIAKKQIEVGKHWSTFGAHSTFREASSRKGPAWRQQVKVRMIG
jgi:hypothetical protein